MRRFGYRRLGLSTVACATVLLAAACSGGGGGGNGNQGGSSSSLTISSETGEVWTCDFNPYNPADETESFGLVYEPLEFVNNLNNGAVSPMLATGYAWSNDNRTLTFTIRSGVKWSDGKPFTAADVVYSFNLLKAHSSLDLNSVWSALSSVAQQESNKVVFTFKSSSVPYFYYIADQVPIVPEHVWSKVSNPVTYPDTKPVATGPYVMAQCSGQNIQYRKNTNYWQPGLPKVETINWPAFTSNESANEYLATGQAQWGAQFIPSIKAFYTSKSSSYHYWFPPVSNVYLFLNLDVAPLNNVAVRQAISYAIDRSKVSNIGEYGYEPPASQTGVATPTFQSWYDSAAASKYDGYSYNPAKAKQILAAAGFRPGPNGVDVSPSGQRLSFTVLNTGGNSDWVADMQVIAGELKAVGISVTPDNLSANQFSDDVLTGKYQMGYDAEYTYGPSPYYELRALLYSANTAPIGQSATTNYERYRNPATDRLFDEYASTTNSATRHQLMDQIQETMLSQVPAIPVVENVDWFEYDTGSFSGWVTQSNPYAQPNPGAVPDWGVQAARLQSK